MRLWRFVKTRQWRSAVAELVLVIAGVLIALAVDSWRGDRNDRNRERAYLRQLLSDVRATERRLETSIAEDSVIFANVSRFMDAANTYHATAGPAPSADSLRSWAVTAYSSFVPLTGTYSALMQNDGLRLLRNDSLRFHVIAFAATMASSQDVLRHTEGQTWRNSERADLAWWRNLMQPSGGRRWRREADVEALLRDPEILNTFTMQRTVGENRLGTMRGLREPVATLRRMLERELKISATRPS
ncbi:MAG: hypothetical protein AVDCRST_MAG68-3611 [uncultured Gemmatimonadetes bacterium]|uniref:Uncharacterized protein n=1 Tax=uncultured Gemmatimonadota bacterium TaxID=203437 RepID=A0A6J4M6J8_9BACT|nr:MAG: hypothetical protein AVDCRST_MAG68-3611 [uncultured Gemmatimonadota bacterium]